MTDSSADEIRRLREAADQARKTGDLRGAIRDYRAALLLDESPPAAELDRLGTLLHLTGERAAAIACFHKARTLEGRRMIGARAARGRDQRLMLVGFTGFHGLLGVAKLNFLDAAGLRDCSRLLLWDAGYRFFLGGLPRLAPGFGALTDFIRKQIGVLAPQKVLVVGCSGSGFAALLYGHAIGADVVHAFSPAVSFDLPQVERFQPSAVKQYGAMMMEIAASGVEPSLLHLPTAIERDNGKTRYFVHYGRLNRDDNERVQHLRGLPGVELIEHETASHATAELLAGANLLKAVFETDDAAAIPRLS